MRRREEKRREFHEALLQTLYPPSSSSSASSSPSVVDLVDEEPFDVTLINPEDYVKIDSSINQDDVNENGDESETAKKPSRAQRKRLRKKMLKEETARRKKVIGPLLPIKMNQTTDGRVIDAGRSNVEEQASCSQPVRCNAQEKEEIFDGNDKQRKVKKRREAKKLAKESSNPIHLHDPTPSNSN